MAADHVAAMLSEIKCHCPFWGRKEEPLKMQDSKTIPAASNTHQQRTPSTYLKE